MCLHTAYLNTFAKLNAAAFRERDVERSRAWLDDIELAGRPLCEKNSRHRKIPEIREKYFVAKVFRYTEIISKRLFSAMIFVLEICEERNLGKACLP